ncbi:YoaK family protein [Hymenobacter ginkgonis]|uniref:YoaK family protein n=1 Tax=Hymenobacter ginkgonis TaxID=2682976 RepID=UPI0012F9A7EE|nr:YoaK family protein [Hymenobacter ginkgonis]
MADSTTDYPAPTPPTVGLSLGVVTLAGLVDAVSYLEYNRVYVSIMSGNTTALGVAVANGQHAQAGRLGLVVGLFVGGVVLGTGLHRVARRQPASVVLGVVAALLLLAYAWPALAIECLALGMGIINASVHQLGGVNVSLTYVTGALVKAGTGLADLLSGRPASRDWAWQALGWVCFLAGSFGGALIWAYWGLETLVAASGCCLLLALWARRVPVA